MRYEYGTSPLSRREYSSSPRLQGATSMYDYGWSPSSQRAPYTFSPHSPMGGSGDYSQVLSQIVGRHSVAADDGRRNPPPLSWRLHPDESLSDWTLTVASTDSVPCSPKRRRRSVNAMDDAAAHDNPAAAEDNLADAMSPPSRKYHVHRAQLAVGPRRSDYFATLFKNRRRMLRSGDTSMENGADANGTYIELKASAAAVFPTMLDFIYSPISTPVEATTESAVALRHLASCFGIREMFNSFTEYIKGDLRPETAPTYLLEAATYKHDELIAASLKMCTESLQVIKLSTIVLLPPELFELVVRSPHLVCESEVLSTRIASYCRCRPGGIDLETLLSLTDAEVMPRITPDESLFYIHLLSLLGVDLPDHSRSGAAPTLYERCVAASPNVVRGALQVKHSPVCTHKSQFHDRHRQTTNKDYDDLPAGVKVDLLESTIADSCHAETMPASVADVEKKDEFIADSHSSHEIKGELSAAKEEIGDLQSEIKHLRTKLEKTIKICEAKLSAREDEVQRCKEELSRFVRVPNNCDVPSACTYQEDTEFDRYGESVIGQIPPIAMPRFEHAPRDGLIYREKDRFDTRYWPMFYYKGDKN